MIKAFVPAFTHYNICYIFRFICYIHSYVHIWEKKELNLHCPLNMLLGSNEVWNPKGGHPMVIQILW